MGFEKQSLGLSSEPVEIKETCLFFNLRPKSFSIVIRSVERSMKTFNCADTEYQ